MILAPDTPQMPTVATIAYGFALLCGLAILRAVHRLYDQGIRHEHLPAKIERLSTEVLRLADMVHAFTARFDAHCLEEERSQEETRANAIHAANVTHAAMSESETRLTDSIRVLSTKVDEMGERRKRTRT